MEDPINHLHPSKVFDCNLDVTMFFTQTPKPTADSPLLQPVITCRSHAESSHAGTQQKL